MYQALHVITYISIFGLLFESAYVFSKWSAKIHGYLFFTCVTMLVNNAGYLMELTADSESAYFSGLRMAYLGKSFIPLAFLVFVMALCKIDINKNVYLVLGIIHTITFFLVFTAKRNHIYYSEMTYVEEGLFPHLEMKYGFWHTGYTILLLLYILIGLSALTVILIREKNQLSRTRLYYVYASVFIISLFYIIHLTGVTGCYDATVLGYSLGTVFMTIAIIRYNLLDTLELAKEYITDELSEAIIAVDHDEKAVFYNKPAMSLFPKIKKNLPNIIEEIKYSIKTGEPLEIGDRIYSPEEKILEKGGVTGGRLFVLVDDTDHFKYLAELKEQKEIAEKANASKSAFLSVVSHEIRTPMNAVVGMTDLLLKDKESLNSKQEKYLKNIKTSGTSLVMIVNDILDQSKIEAGKMELIEGNYDIRKLIQDVMMIIENRIGSKPVSLEYSIEDAVPDIMVGDGLRIRQILINLMNNSVKFTEEGYIKLSVRCIDSEEGRVFVRFDISDTGLGIKEEDLEKLGQSFTQVDAKTNYGKEGTGLGLSISKDFVAMMGGQLEVASQYRKGSDFFFSIWQKLPETEADEGVTQKKQVWEEEDFTAPGASILIVDDTPINLMVTEELLEPLKMSVDTAANAKQAFAMLEKNSYNLVFMDYMMPEIDGIEATKHIRDMGKESDDRKDFYHNLPIVALTADTTEETKANFEKAGINDFIEKPVNIRSLKQILIKWLPKELLQTEK